MCTGKGAKYLLFLAIAPQGKFFEILCLDSHIWLDYIYFLGGLLFSNCPARENFFGYKQSSLAFLIVFSRERQEKIPHPQHGKKFGTFQRRIPPSLKKKNTAKRLLRSSNFFSQNSLRSPKTVCAARFARCLRAHVRAVRGLIPPLYRNYLPAKEFSCF